MKAGEKGLYSTRKGTLGMRERMKDARHDPYEEKKKWPDRTKCTRCGAVYMKGRWTWNPGGTTTGKTLCPACRRIEDDYPAGTLEIGGDFAASHSGEISGLLRNVEAQEMGEHPLERIMSIVPRRGSTVVTTTGIHLARRLGEALSSAYDGELSIKFGDGDEHIQVAWQR